MPKLIGLMDEVQAGAPSRYAEAGGELPAGQEALVPAGRGVLAPYQQRGFGAEPAPWRYEQSHLLGLSTVVVATSAITGLRLGGVYGAFAGSLFGGAGMNLLRAVRLGAVGEAEASKEALVSGTYALVACGLGVWLLYKGRKVGG